VTEQDAVAQPEESVVVRPPPTTTDMRERVRLLEREAAAAKQREMKVLESLVQQTKEMERAKVAFEESRLEVAALRRQQHDEGAAAQAQAQQWSVMDLMFGGVDEEINGLRTKLRAAAQAEERGRKAADELAAALAAVTMEAKQLKAWLADAQAELEAAGAESDRLRGLLQGAEAELWSATERADALASDWKEAAAGWRAREKALLARARAAEKDDDNAALRRALERAAEEARASAEALEAARADCAGLREAGAEREQALEALRRDNDGLRDSEAAARERADELQARLAAAKEREVPLPLVERWKREDAQGKLGATAFLDSGRLGPGPGRKDRMFASLSNLAELKSAAALDDYGYEFDHLNLGQYGDGTERKVNKRRSILRKFGDLFRRSRSLYKPNLAPVLHNHY
jgi:murein DD-endopeptidase MepM/ murein hydrolase activator NlpD